MSAGERGRPDGFVPLLGPAEIRDLAGLLGLTPTKKLGQNFVIDPNTVRRIVTVAGVRPGDSVLEVGPGLGSLTLGLLDAGAAVVAVEIDGRLAAQLPLTVEAMRGSATGLAVVHADALAVTELPAPVRRIVANLPYNVSVPVLLHLLAALPELESGVVMVQAEVGHRIAAGPGSKVYGAPSAKAAWYGTWKVAGAVGRRVFWPVPNVDSVLVSFERSAVSEDAGLRRTVFLCIDAAFGQRRKMLRQSLSSLAGGSAEAVELCESAGVDPTLRAEQLGIDQFVSIAETGWGSSGARR